MFNFNSFRKQETSPQIPVTPQEIQAAPEIRVVGKVPPETKEKAKEKMLGYFGEKHLESLPEKTRKMILKKECRKTPEELELIEFADKESSELMEKTGVKPYSIPVKNIHILPEKIYQKLPGAVRNSVALTYYDHQMIAINAPESRKNKKIMAEIIFHEYVHLKGRLAVQIEPKKDFAENKEIKPRLFRTGLTVEPSRKKDEQGLCHRHFKGLHDAVVSYAEKNFSKKLLELPMFQAEKQWLESSLAGKFMNEISQKYKIPPEYISWISRDGEEWTYFSYPRHQRVLSFILKEVQKEFPDKYKTTDDAYSEFLKSQFAGSLLNLARPIEKTFGEGNFKVLGMMTSAEESAIQMLEHFQHARLRQLKKKNKTL